MWLSHYIAKIADQHRASSLFPEKPTIDFHPRSEGCQAGLRVIKTSRKTVITLTIGPFCVRETILQDSAGRLLSSRQLMMTHQSPGYVQKQLGHSSISITMDVDVYCHWIPGEGRGGLEEALGGAEGNRGRVPNGGEKVHISAYQQKGSQQDAETL